MIRIIPSLQLHDASPELLKAVNARVAQCNPSDPVVVTVHGVFDINLATEHNFPIATAYLYTEDLAGGWTIFQVFRTAEGDKVVQIDMTVLDIERMNHLLHIREKAEENSLTLN